MKLLKNYYNETQAHIDKGMLASAGIKTILVYNSLSGVFPAPDSGISNVELFVDHSQYDEACALLNEKNE